MSKLRLPDNSQRITIVGSTGSGKTLAGLWHLSNSDFLSMPYIIVDFKRDENIGQISRAEEIGLQSIPKRAGIYIVRPIPTDKEAITSFFYKIWQNENVGVWIDEGHMMGDDGGMIACLTQGRSKHIPMIVLSQRPAWISRFVFSESNFFQVYRLTDERDRKTIGSFLPKKHTLVSLPDFHSVYFDVGRNALHVFRPVPMAEITLERIDQALRRRKKLL